MPPESSASIDLEDLKLLPAWVKESPDARQYEHFEGEPVGRGASGGRDRRGRGPQGLGRDRGDDRRKPPGAKSDRHEPRRAGDRRDRPGPPGKRDRPPRAGDRHGRDRRQQDRHLAPAPKPPPEIAVRFIPQPPAFERISEQIKADSLAYSVFALARLFLQKPERYDVHLAAKPESPMFQLGENGAVSSDRTFLENNAFRLAQKDFYKIDITQTDPVKGNFTSVARDRLSGTLLGPTNHHAYQPRLRSLYEQRFSRRMSFPDYQRQIEIVSDPALVEQWKEEARTVTTFSTLKEEPPATFNNAAEAERHFRQKYLPDLVRAISEITIGGVESRNLGDRVLRRLIEDSWTAQTRSPSQMMQELSTRLRESALNIFRHRKGMLFVSPIRVRQAVHEETSVSDNVKAILDTVGANPKINRKDLAEKLMANVPAEEVESRKLALASDLKWLVSEGYVIEFNDGSLDLPRAKPKKEEPASSVEADVPAAVGDTTTAEAKPAEEHVDSTESRPSEETRAAELEIGGS